VALLLILLALLGFGFVAAGSGSGSSGSSPKVVPAQRPHHHLRCSARMNARPSAGENQRCGGPPANP
jgi:hypothetical protein